MKFYSAQQLPQVTTGPTPSSGFNSLYFKSDDRMYVKNSSGVETLMGPGDNSLTAVAYRSTVANQAVTQAAYAAMNIQGTAEHDVGSGFTRSGDVVTVVNAGVYHLHALVAWDGTWPATTRVVLHIETWTGSDPGVGAATQIAIDEGTALQGVFPALNATTQKTLAAGAKVRAILFHNGSGATRNTSAGLTGSQHQLNIIRLDSIATADTGWLRPGDAGGPTWGTSWADFDSTNYRRTAMRKVDTTVRLVGTIQRTTGTAGTILTLPVGSRPPRGALFNARSNTAYAEILVNADGTVVLSIGTYTNAQAMVIDCTFDTNEP